MKKIYALLIASFLTLPAINAFAQSSNDGFSALIQSGPADATKLAQAYGEPLFKGIGLGLNSGWYNTAKTKGLLHFDLSISVSAALGPTSEQTGDVTKIGLSSSVRPDN